MVNGMEAELKPEQEIFPELSGLDHVPDGLVQCENQPGGGCFADGFF